MGQYERLRAKRAFGETRHFWGVHRTWAYFAPVIIGVFFRIVRLGPQALVDLRTLLDVLYAFLVTWGGSYLINYLFFVPAALHQEQQRELQELSATVERLGQASPSPELAASTPEEQQNVYEIRFDYLPETPIERKEWVRAYGDGTVNFKTNPDMPGSLSMEVTGVFAMDHPIPPHATLCDRLKFEARYSNSTMIFTGLDVKSRNAAQRKTVWIKYYIGDRPPEQTQNAQNDPKHLPELTVWIKGEPLQSGWRAFDISLRDTVESALGAQGWVYSSIWKLRLRGSLSISSVVLIESVSPQGS